MQLGARTWAMLPWILATCFTAVDAHHSTTEFDYSKQVTIKGSVKEIQWTNPHSYIQLIVDGEGGEEVQWSVEIGSPSLNIRRIRMNASHLQTLEPGYVGDSVGHWEGNTLVVDTLGFNGYAELDARGQPTSPRLHTVERFTPSADGGSIDIETTIEDLRERLLRA